MTFKKGDWVFHDHELKQVVEVDKGQVVEVTCGIGATSGNCLLCFPLEMKYKRASGAAHYWSRKFHEYNWLNHPDISRKLNELWVDLCNNIDDKKLAQEGYKAIDEFGSSIINSVNSARSSHVGGITIFR